MRFEGKQLQAAGKGPDREAARRPAASRHHCLFLISLQCNRAMKLKL